MVIDTVAAMELAPCRHLPLAHAARRRGNWRSRRPPSTSTCSPSASSLHSSPRFPDRGYFSPPRAPPSPPLCRAVAVVLARPALIQEYSELRLVLLSHTAGGIEPGGLESPLASSSPPASNRSCRARSRRRRTSPSSPTTPTCSGELRLPFVPLLRPFLPSCAADPRRPSPCRRTCRSGRDPSLAGLAPGLGRP